MFTVQQILVFILLQLSMGIATAAMEAVTDDGKRVRLLDDQTWEFIDTDGDGAEAIEPKITIEVLNKTDRHGQCIYGLRLQNNTNFKIISLVPQFTAHIAGDVEYENVFRGFQRIKTTRDQFQELKFSRIKCAEITRIKVHGGDRCAMGDLTKYSTEKGVCLSHVKIIPSPLVNIAK